MVLVSTLKNQWLLIRRAAGIRSADTQTLNAFRALNFAMMFALLTWPLVCLLVWWVILDAQTRISPTPIRITVYLYSSIVFSVVAGVSYSSRLLIIPTHKIRNQILITSMKGFLVTVLVAFSLGTLLVLAITNFFSTPGISALLVLLFLVGLVSVGFKFWQLKPNRYRVPVWLFNMLAVALFVPVPLIIFLFYVLLALSTFDG